MLWAKKEIFCIWKTNNSIFFAFWTHLCRNFLLIQAWKRERERWQEKKPLNKLLVNRKIETGSQVGKFDWYQAIPPNTLYVYAYTNWPLFPRYFRSSISCLLCHNKYVSAFECVHGSSTNAMQFFNRPNFYQFHRNEIHFNGNDTAQTVVFYCIPLMNAQMVKRDPFAWAVIKCMQFQWPIIKYNSIFLRLHLCVRV